MNSDSPSSSPTAQTFAHEARQLTEDEIAKLCADRQLVAPFRQTKLETDAKKNWDLFYKRNLDKFFRDRHWTTREFEELLRLPQMNTSDGKRLNLLEAGCGVGNFIWPLIKLELPFTYYACDFSPVALDLFKSNELYDEQTFGGFVFQADLSKAGAIAEKVDAGLRFHVVSLIFVLSAIHPEKMATALRNVAEVLDEDEGILILRDYGLYDYAQLRFAAGSKLGENYYVRQDGTRAYYFSKELLTDMANSCDLEVLTLEYVQRETVNLKKGLAVPRIFVQGKFRRRKRRTEGEEGKEEVVVEAVNSSTAN